MSVIARRTAEWPDAAKHESALLALVADAQRLYPSCRLGVGTGWSSPKILHERDACAPLTAWVWEIARPHGAVHLDAWANVLRVGDSIAEHDHYLAIATAIYGLQGEGELLVGDEAVPILPGRVLILDGRQVHSVAPCKSPRISIVMNLYG